MLHPFRMTRDIKTTTERFDMDEETVRDLNNCLASFSIPPPDFHWVRDALFETLFLGRPRGLGDASESDDERPLRPLRLEHVACEDNVRAGLTGRPPERSVVEAEPHRSLMWVDPTTKPPRKPRMAKAGQEGLGGGVVVDRMVVNRRAVAALSGGEEARGGGGGGAEPTTTTVPEAVVVPSGLQGKKGLNDQWQRVQAAVASNSVVPTAPSGGPPSLPVVDVGELVAVMVTLFVFL